MPHPVVSEVYMEERCVICGAIIPEGRQVCPVCEGEGNRLKDSPCRYCTDRKLLCHGSCELYKAYRIAVEKEAETRQRERDACYPFPKEIMDKMAKVSRNRRSRGL